MKKILLILCLISFLLPTYRTDGQTQDGVDEWLENDNDAGTLLNAEHIGSPATYFLEDQGDSSYLDITKGGGYARWYTFDDTVGDAGIYTVNISIYVILGDGNDDINWYIDTSGDDNSEYDGQFVDPTSGNWYTMSVGDLSQAEVNYARLMLESIASGKHGDHEIDIVRLGISKAGIEDIPFDRVFSWSDLDESDGYYCLDTQIPVIEEIDLLVDGSIIPQVFTPNETALYWMRSVWSLHFIDASVDFTVWGADGGNLENGTSMFYDDINLLPGNITNTHDFVHTAYNLDWFQDDKTPKDNHFVSRYSFFRHTPNGLYMPDHTFRIIVADNITAEIHAIDHFKVYLQGYTILNIPGGAEDETPDINIQGFLDDQLKIAVAIFPWLLLIGIVVGILYLFRKHLKV